MIRSLFFSVLLCGTAHIALAQSAVINEHFKALNNHDVGAIAAGYANDAQIFSPNWEGAKTGQDGVTEIYSRDFKSTPDLSYTVTNTIDAGNMITVENTFWRHLQQSRSRAAGLYEGEKIFNKGLCHIYIEGQ